MRKEIISVEVANRVIKHNTAECLKEGDLSVFPFERFYLTRSPELIPRMFRYYLSMPLNDVLLRGMNNIIIHKTNKASIERDDKSFKPTENKNKINYFSFITDPKAWVLIVPTVVTTTVDGDFVLYTLHYIVAQGISPYHNKKPNLPQIKLHTPRGKPSILCGRCVNITKMYNGDCSPGTNECALNHKVIIDKKKLRKTIKSET